MSEMIEQIYDVVSGAKNRIVEEIDIHGSITEERARNIVKLEFDNVAYKRGIKTGTVMDKATRQMEYGYNDFVQAVIDFLTGRNNDILDRLKTNCKKIKGGDNPANILFRMTNIRMH